MNLGLPLSLAFLTLIGTYFLKPDYDKGFLKTASAIAAEKGLSESQYRTALCPLLKNNEDGTLTVIMENGKKIIFFADANIYRKMTVKEQRNGIII